jgi:hypothetical protein
MYGSHDLSPRLNVSIVLAELDSKHAFSAHPVSVLPDFYPVDQVLKVSPI